MTRTLLTAVFLAALAGSAQAATAQGDASHGRQLVYTCAGCHGVPGYENAYPNYRVPRIAGQNYDYLVAALTEYRTGGRSHPTMRAQAESMSEQDIKDIATYLSSLAPAK
ncbi:MAG TPA: cytochrome c [Rhodanobacteraceae bacterium]|nr:cytochrome c [Rhodanobacteraceae bacterium]